jgi:hypothetical protein
LSISHQKGVEMSLIVGVFLMAAGLLVLISSRDPLNTQQATILIFVFVFGVAAVVISHVDEAKKEILKKLGAKTEKKETTEP